MVECQQQRLGFDAAVPEGKGTRTRERNAVPAALGFEGRELKPHLRRRMEIAASIDRKAARPCGQGNPTDVTAAPRGQPRLRESFTADVGATDCSSGRRAPVAGRHHLPACRHRAVETGRIG